MQEPRKKVHVAILDADRTVPAVRDAYGPYYSSRFAQVLHQAGQRARSKSNQTAILEFSAWNVMEFEYPQQDTIDAIIVTGSVKGAYDPDPWIQRLLAFVRDTYDRFPHVKIFAACFGHELVGQALLHEHGVVAAKDPNGFELGVQVVTFNPAFAAYFDGIIPPPSKEEGEPEKPSQLAIQFIHGDILEVRSSLPEPWMNVGTTQHCQMQGLFNPGRVFTLQGHCEWNEYICYESIKYCFTPAIGWSAERTEEALKMAQRKPDEGERVIDLVYAFLVGDADVPGAARKDSKL